MDGMDPPSAQNQQENLESMLVRTETREEQQKKMRPQPEHSLKCPRCDSYNTKFCYYNNYSLTQPRYFCKSCRRYWTKGGTLRNVPVGGGCRKNKRLPSSPSKRRTQDQTLASSNPSPLSGLDYDPSDLSLLFARLQEQSTGQLGLDGHGLRMMVNPGSTPGGPIGFVEAQNGFRSSCHQNSFGHFENGGVGINSSEETAMIGYDQDHVAEAAKALTGAVKQEHCNGREGEQRALWGFPWHNGGNGNLGEDFEDAGMGSWNWVGSTWHGLLNSPLM